MQNIVKNKKGKMTMDKLAQMTANGFGELRTELKGDIDGLKVEVNELKNKIDDSVGKILIAADGMAKQFSDWKQENSFGAGIEARQDEQLQDHEVRIKKLETV